MKLSATFAALALAGSAVAAKAAVHSSKMQKLMSLKMQDRQKSIDEGMLEENRYAALATTSCVNGDAGGFKCNNVDMQAFLSHQDMGSSTREGSDIWGWTSSTGREFALVGQTDGTAFVEILSDGSLSYVGRLPTQTYSSNWRDIKVIGDYAYIGAEAWYHGLQVFDLTKLLSIPSGTTTTFSTNSDLAARHTGFTNSHNIVANEDTDMIYVVGSNQCSGGLYMLDVSTPSDPTFVGCVSSDGYVHDAQCIVYPQGGADSRYAGREICFNFNEDTLTIVDVTDKSSPVTLSKASYPGVAYTHQGWLADSSARYMLVDDELDEVDGTSGTQRTTTYIFDLLDLTNPVYTGKYLSPAISIDHNQYVIDGLSYQSNYGSGLRIVDVSSVASDPTGAGFSEVGYFDVSPEDDDSTTASFLGAWSVYPYFQSGTLIVNSIERGLFALKYTG